MLWFYERNDDCLRVETKYDREASEYVVMVRYADGREQIQRFAETIAFRIWLESLERTLQKERWTLRGGTEILPDGWPLKVDL